MKTLAIFSGVIALAPGLLAGVQTVSLTPQSLPGWIVGNGPVSSESGLAVPAGGQLARRFETSQVTVELRAKPVFGVADKELVTLEVGPAAVVFTRGEDHGELVVVVDDKAPAILPGSIKLDDGGLSSEPVDIEVSYNRATGDVSVSVLGLVTHYASNRSTRPIDVILSAGATDAVPVEKLEVHVSAPDLDAGSASQTAGEKTDADPAHAAGREAKRGLAFTGPSGTSPSLGGATTTKPPTSGSAGLEIFTPPAVHLGRVDAVRSAVGQAAKL